jgi:hypothetical protein
MEVRVHRHAASAVPLGDNPGAHLIGGRFVSRAVLDEFGDDETSSAWYSNSDPFRPWTIRYVTNK